MDIASETGTYGLDEISLTDPFLAGSEGGFRHFDNPKHPFNVKLNQHLKKASGLKKEQYGHEQGGVYWIRRDGFAYGGETSPNWLNPEDRSTASTAATTVRL
jgi:hypothetical protein